MSKNAALRRFRARQNGATMLSQVRRLAVIGVIVAAGMAARPASADASLPSGATVAVGSAHIDAGASSVTVNQSSARAVINWTGFSVGAGNSVVFNQPDAQSATLNRVTGSASSTIAGQITSNGAVYLVNPNGIAITASGAIDTRGGFVASTLDIADNDFMGGNLAFAGQGSSASVTNAGTIRAGENAFVALLGGTVSNSGTITVPLGKVGLGSGERIALDLNGGNFLQVSVPTSVLGDAALIDNAGTISASGGSVVLSAATVKSAVRNVINMLGAINADSAVADGGVIRLLGGEGGTVTASGNLSARATSAAGNGGTVETSGATVDFTGLSVDTRAANGKTGLWLIDPTDLNVDQTAANTISANLLTSNVQLDTFGDGTTAGPGTPTPGAGDININGVINWNSNNNLTLNAFNNVNFNAALHWTGDGVSGSGLFNVNAGRDINFSAPIDWNKGFGLFFNAARDITVNAALSSNTNTFLSLYADRNADAQGTVIFGRFGSVSTNGAVVNLFYNPAGGDYTNPTGYSGSIGLYNAGGSGTGSFLFPYMLVNTLTDLQAINTNVAGIYALNTDIDASATAGWNGGAGFVPIGLGSSGGIIGNGFVGQLNGQGHTINGLTINRPNNDDVGLFGYFNGVLGSLALTNVAITGRSSVGGAIGYLDTFVKNTCLFCGANNASSVSVSGTISGVNNVGGLVGFSTADINGGSVDNATITGRVASDGSGGNGVGGILGTQMAGTVKDTVTTNSVSVLGAPNVGGVVGALGGGTIHNVQSLATVTGINGTGGVVGSAFGGAIDASAAAAVVNGAGNAGGFVGVVAGPVTINSSVAHSAVTATGYAVGGFVGAMDGGGTITNSTASGSVSGYAFVGGFAGAINPDTVTGNSGTITGSTVIGSTVSGVSIDPMVDNPVGGFVGFAGAAQLGNDTVDATTTVNGFNDTGGFIGLANQSSVLSQVSSAAVVTATNNNIGGLAGALIDGSTLDGGTATGSVRSPNGVTIGGLVGYLTGTVSHSTATGAVTGLGFVGGLVGNINGGGLVTNSVASGVVTGSDPVNSDKIGGLVGHASVGTINSSQTLATSRVSGGSNIGGIIGQASSSSGLRLERRRSGRRRASKRISSE